MYCNVSDLVDVLSSTVIAQKWLNKTTLKSFSELTNNRPSNKSESNGHARASGLVASLSSDWPVCIIAYKVKRVDQPKQRWGGKKNKERIKTHLRGKKWSFLSGGWKPIVSLTLLYCRQIRWQWQQRWRLQNHPAFQAQRAGCEFHTCPGASGVSPKRAENQSDMITDLGKHSFGVCNILNYFT